MIIVHLEVTFEPSSDAAMKSIVPEVERFCRKFEGCEQFTVSFPPSPPGTALTTEIWRDERTLRAHIASTRQAPELETWHRLIKEIWPHVFRASSLGLEALTKEETVQ